MDNIQIEKELKEILENLNITYESKYIKSVDTLKNVYELYKNNVQYIPTNNDEYRYLGLYLERVKKDYDKSKEAYLKAIEMGDDMAMNNLGVYYYNIKDYDNAIKYYLMAINKENPYAMTNLV